MRHSKYSLSFFKKSVLIKSSLDTDTIGNGGWSTAKDADDESNTSSSTSSSSSSSSSKTERHVQEQQQQQQHLEEQLINNSSDDSSNDQFSAKLRSKTLPELYTRLVLIFVTF